MWEGFPTLKKNLGWGLQKFTKSSFEHIARVLKKSFEKNTFLVKKIDSFEKLLV